MLLMCLLAPSIAAQPRFSVAADLGSARDGSWNSDVIDLSAQVRAFGPLFALVGFEGLAKDSGCTGSRFDQTWCGYNGSTWFGGVRASFLNIDRLFGGLRAEVGRFKRSEAHLSPEYTDSEHLAVAIGADLGLNVLGPLGIRTSAHHRRIYDEAYRLAFGERPHLTAITIGGTLGFGGRLPGLLF
jgi:hypothetical protein